jgi:hypothetical protein
MVMKDVAYLGSAGLSARDQLFIEAIDEVQIRSFGPEGL